MMIEEVTQITEEVFQAFQRLIPQLTQHSLPPSWGDLQTMVGSPGTVIFIARQDDEHQQIIGSATLGIFQTPTGRHGWIEDVIVDKGARRQGVGKALTEACLQKARDLGLREVNLTSRPGRKAANQLYISLGFSRRESNLYRYKLS
jgi:ribosomal protein S18 acetylase RimI-like enzyme